MSFRFMHIFVFICDIFEYISSIFSFEVGEFVIARSCDCRVKICISNNL